jgi:hypothetical protein
MFGSKKEKKGEAQREETPLEKEARERQQKVEKSVMVHTMPEKYRAERQVAGQSKKFGILIILGGAALLIIVATGLYYFLILNTPVKTSQTSVVPAQTQTPEPTAEVISEATTSLEEIGAGTIAEILPEASTSSTTTEENLSLAPAPDSLADSDQDGLNDLEEKLLGTNTNSVDTDGDGYGDYTELMNLYNPLGAGALSGNKNIATYQNATNGYSILYPANWLRSAVGGEDSIIFNSNDNHFVQIVVQANGKLESINSWYGAQFGSASFQTAQKVSFDNWSGLRNSENGAYYLADKGRNYIIAITYTPNADNKLVYKDIFEMMARSFSVK